MTARSWIALFLLCLAPAAAARAQDAAAAPQAVPAPSAPTLPSAPDLDNERVARATPAPGVTRFTLPAHPGIPSLDYVGHRFHEKVDSGGWGWVRLAQDGWNRARWVAVLETPGVAIAPWRNMGGRIDDDQNYEFKLRGYIAPYQIYDPHTNEMLDVFVLEDYEAIAPAKPLSLQPGPPARYGRRSSSYSSRDRGLTDF